MAEQEFPTRYRGYNVLDKWSSPDWDDQTREVVRLRLEEVPPVRFFTEEEARTSRQSPNASCRSLTAAKIARTLRSAATGSLGRFASNRFTPCPSIE